MERGVATCSLQAAALLPAETGARRAGPQSAAELRGAQRSGSSCDSGAANSALEGVSRQQNFPHCLKVSELAKPAKRQKNGFRLNLEYLLALTVETLSPAL